MTFRDSLSIAPGTIIKLKPNARIIIQDTLDATQAVFTSINDDSAGPDDTDNDGNLTPPQPGDWGWIEFQDDSDDENCLMESCQVRYGGRDYYSSAYHNLGAVNLIGASPRIEGNDIAYSYQGLNIVGPSQAKIYCNRIHDNQEEAAYVKDADPIFSHNSICDNGFGVRNLTPGKCVQATNNWWGDAAGPFDSSAAPDACGLADNSSAGQPVSDNVRYSPWLSKLCPCPCEPDRTAIYVGDANCSSKLDIADAVCILGHLFGPKTDPCKSPCCLAQMDSNDSNAIDIADAVRLLSYLFAKGDMLGPDASVIKPANEGCELYPAAEVTLPCDQPCTP